MGTEEIQQRLAMDYLSAMKNREMAQKPACIIFSGVPGSGKTTLARKLAHDLRAQYIRHDDIRELARSHGYDVASLTISSISRIVMDVIMNEDANRRVVIDASLDRSWPLFFDHTREHGALPVIIRLNVPRPVVEKRISERNRDDFGSVTDLDTFFAQFENSKQKVRADIELDQSYDYQDVLKRVTELLG
jgi:predicted kinase